MAAHKEHIEELKARRDLLFERIAREWGPEDVTIGPVDRESKALITLRMASDVPLAPLHTLAERLVNHLLTIDFKKWGGAPAMPAKAKHEAEPRPRQAGIGARQDTGVVVP